MSPASAGPDGPIEVSADVTNTGSRAGDEVVQLYLRDKVASVVQPLRELRGFQRVTLKRGETKTSRSRSTRDDFSLVNAANQTVVEPGAFDVWVSDSSTGGLQGSFAITG